MEGSNKLNRYTMAQNHSTIDNDLTLGNSKTSIVSLLNSLATNKFDVRFASKQTDAATYSGNHPGALVLCPNGLFINGMIIASPDQEIGISFNKNNGILTLTVDGSETAIDLSSYYATKGDIENVEAMMESDYATKEDVAALTESGMVLVGEIDASTNRYHITADSIKSATDAENTGDLFMTFVGTGHRQSDLRRYFDIKAGWQFKVAVAGTIQYESASSVGGNDQTLTLEVGDTVIFTNALGQNSQQRAETGNIRPEDIMVLQTNVDKASKNSLGLVKVGDNINVDGNGTISVPAATKSALGVVKVGGNITAANDGTISVPTATTSVAGVGKIGNMVNAVGVNISQKVGTGVTLGVTVDGKSGSADLPLADGTNAGVSINDYTTVEKGLLAHLGSLGLKWGGHLGEWWTINDSKNNLTIYLYPNSPTMFKTGASSYSLARLEQIGSGSGVNTAWALVEYNTSLQPTGYWLQYSANQGLWVRVVGSSVVSVAGSGNFKYQGSSADSEFFNASYTNITASGITAEANLVVMVANDGTTLDLNTLNRGDLLIFRSSSIHDYTIVRGGFEAWEKQKLSGVEVGATRTIVWTGTQAQYDAITTKDSKTIYLITDVAWYDQYTSLSQLITALNSNGVGVIRSISVGGTAITPDASKNVNIPVATTSQNGVVKKLSSGDYSVASTADATMTIVSGNEGDVVVAEVMKAVYDKINIRLKEIENALTWKSV